MFNIFASIEEFDVKVLRSDLLSSYSIVIVDQNFGDSEVTGCDLVKQLRDERDYKGIMIGFSGDNEKEKEFLANGACLFWLKPLPSDEQIVQDLSDAFQGFFSV
jgi:CheY-like chemotaxis protein